MSEPMEVYPVVMIFIPKDGSPDLWYDNNLPVMIEMPCGIRYEFPTRRSFPSKTCKCICGDERELVIKYEE